MRELNVMEMVMVVGGAGEAAGAPVCTTGGNANSQSNTCVIGDLMITNTCTTTQIEARLGGTVEKASAKIEVGGKFSSTSCMTTTVNTKTGATTTTNNTPGRSMTPGSAPRSKQPGVLLIEGEYYDFSDW